MNQTAFQPNPGTFLYRYRYQFVQLLFLCLIFGKGFDRLWHAGIWAEDGQVFLKLAFETGWPGLFQPYAGYFHTIPKLAALFASHLPMNWIPYFLVVASYLLFWAVIITPLRQDYRWLFPELNYAFFASLLLFLSPGQKEMLGNMTNIHWYLMFWLMLLGLKDPKRPFTLVELAAAFLSIASEGAALIFLPLFVVRTLYKLKTSNENSGVKGEIFVILTLIIFTVLCFAVKEGTTSTSLSSKQFTIFYRSLFNFLMVHPFVGDSLTVWMQEVEGVLIPLELGLLASFIYLWKNRWQKEQILLLAAILCALGLPIMISLARPEAAGILKKFIDNENWFIVRYSFFLPATAAIIWPFVLGGCKKAKRLRITLTIVLLASPLLNLYRFPIPPYGNNGDWQRRAEILEQSLSTGCPKAVYVQIYPQGWMVQFTSPVTAECK